MFPPKTIRTDYTNKTNALSVYECSDFFIAIIIAYFINLPQLPKATFIIISCLGLEFLNKI